MACEFPGLSPPAADPKGLTRLSAVGGKMKQMREKKLKLMRGNNWEIILGKKRKILRALKQWTKRWEEKKIKGWHGNKENNEGRSLHKSEQKNFKLFERIMHVRYDLQTSSFTTQVVLSFVIVVSEWMLYAARDM